MVRSEFQAFPSREVHAAVLALARMDSITIDPHKLGYLPYGAGAFVCRDHRAMALLSESADYVFHDHALRGYRARYRNLGQFIPEGSKPGANVAAVYVTHKVLPLDDATLVLPGHGGATTIGRERNSNPYLLEAARGRAAAPARGL